MKYLAPFLFVLLCLPAQGQEKKKAADAPGPVFPVDPVPPPPIPPEPPKPGAAVQLGANMTYIVVSDADAIVTARPKGFLKVTKEKGPIKIRSVFPSSKDGQPETKTFTQAYVFVVEPLTKGDCTLMYIPAGAGQDSDITDKIIQVLDGPIPPPVPVTISISPASATVPIGGKQQFTATVSQGGVTWKVSGAGTVDQSGLFTATGSVGTASIVVSSSVDSSKSATATVTVTDVPPPSPAPIPVAGFRVLMVYDKNQLAKLPGAQRDVLYSQTIRAYLDGKVTKGADGLPEYRVYPDDEPMGLESDLWRTVMGRPRNSLPWIVISTGATGTEQPLPGSVADTLALLRKYGG